MEKEKQKDAEELASREVENLKEMLSQLNAKVDSQFRFTRNVVVLCTLTIIGVMVFTITAIFESLPSQIIAHVMSNLEHIVTEWRAYESFNRERDAAKAREAEANAEKPAAQTEDKGEKSQESK